MAVTANDFQLQTLAEKNGSPVERDLTVQTLNEKNGITGGTQGPPQQIIITN